MEDDGGRGRLLGGSDGCAESDAGADSKATETLSKFRHAYEYSNLGAAGSGFAAMI